MSPKTGIQTLPYYSQHPVILFSRMVHHHPPTLLKTTSYPTKPPSKTINTFRWDNMTYTACTALTQSSMSISIQSTPITLMLAIFHVLFNLIIIKQVRDLFFKKTIWLHNTFRESVVLLVLSKFPILSRRISHYSSTSLLSMIYSFSGGAESKVAAFRQAPSAHPKIIIQHASYS